MNIPSKPIGGTELMYNELVKRINPDLLNGVSIFNYVKNADFNKKTIYWNQLFCDQDAVQFLKDEDIKNKIDYFVFVSHWQAETFRKVFNIPGFKSYVIQNAALDIPDKNFEGNKEKIKICYTSTPWRGLNVLLDAWQRIMPENCELHVFSSTQIYGSDFYNTVDFEYKELYDKAKSTPGVVYRGFVDNEKLREELPSFDIMAYPCVFEETSCISVIEALSAGLKVVCSNIGALPETTEGWANIYTIKADYNLHVLEFSNQLMSTISEFKEGKYQEQLKQQVDVYKKKWSWDSRIKTWEKLLINVGNDKVIEPETVIDNLYVDNEYSVGELTKEDVVIDIGAYIGSFAKRCLENGAGKIICYEPSSKNIEILKDNLKDYNNVEIHNLAVWSKSDLNISFSTQRKLDINNNSLGTAFTKNGDSRVNTISLDSILEKFEKVKILKIDAEGSEYPILLNSNLLSKVDEIIGEIHGIGVENQLYNPLSYSKECRIETIIDYLNSQGFKVYSQPTIWKHTLVFKATK